MKTRSPRGVTLVELLVVVAIVLMLGAMVIPNLTPSIESRKLREAARGVDVFIASAKARAARNGRPVGVMIVTAPSNDYAAVTLRLAEVPEPYGGDFSDSAFRMQTTVIPTAPSTIYTVQAQAVRGTGTTDTTFGSTVPIAVGDLVVVGNKGYTYQITAVSGTTLTMRTDTRGGILPWPTSSSSPNVSSPVPYKIYRQPIVWKSSGTVGASAGSAFTYQLPPGIAVDLTGCVFPGVTFDTTAPGSIAPRTIVFSPDGSVDSLYANVGNKFLPTGTIHLLVGKFNKITATSPGPINDATANWHDPSNFYVSVGHLTGQVTTNEVAPIASTSTTLPAKLFDATAFARGSFATGGN